MALEFDLEGAVLLEFGGACAGDLVYFVEAGPGEADLVRSVVDVETGLQRSKAELAVAVGPDQQDGLSAKGEIVATPLPAVPIRSMRAGTGDTMWRAR